MKKENKIYFEQKFQEIENCLDIMREVLEAEE